MRWPEFNLCFWGFTLFDVSKLYIIIIRCQIVSNCMRFSNVQYWTDFYVHSIIKFAKPSYYVAGPGGAGCIQRRAGQPSQHLPVREQPQGETSAGKTISQIPGIWWSPRTLDWMTVNCWLLLKELVSVFAEFFFCVWLCMAEQWMCYNADGQS